MIRPAAFIASAALLIACAALPARAAPASIGLFTIVEGDLVVLRETRQFPAAEGLRLRSEDIVRSGAGTRLARIELGDGTLLDLGPDTELLLQPQALAAERAAAVYLLRGWLKVTTRVSTPAGAAEVAIASARLDAARLAGSAVLRAMPQAALVFVESGRADVLERAGGKAGASHALKDGDAFAARAASPGAALRRPPADLIEGLPRAFADSLPRRARQWQGSVVEAGTGTPIDYADASPWIHAEAQLRPGFVQRFAPLARERRFRTGLIAELRAHPEWDRVLFPEKYRPPPAMAGALRPKPSPAELASVPQAWLDALEPDLSAAAPSPRTRTP
jgi:hypothetical protein